MILYDLVEYAGSLFWKGPRRCGNYERLVGVIKICLKKVVSKAKLNFEEVNTVIVNIEKMTDIIHDL